MIAPPSTSRQGLAWAPATWALLLPLMVMGVSWPWIPAPQAPYITLGLAALGAALGLHLKYRSRFGAAAAVGMNVVGAALFICLAGACVLVVSRMVERPDLSAPALGTTVLILLSCTGLGMAMRHRLYAQAGRAGRLHQLLAPFVDLERFVLRAVPLDAPPPARGGLSIAGAAAIGANVPLLAQQAGAGAPLQMMAVTGLAVPAFAYVLYALIGPGIVHFSCLRRLEREAGHRFERDDAPLLAQARVSFWFARWLCRPEDLAMQLPAEPAAHAARRAAGPTRRQRRKLESTPLKTRRSE